MWNMSDLGILMPSIVPDEYLAKAPGADVGGPAQFPERNMQVRARIESHLTRFIERYMEPGTYSEVIATPKWDYNFRFYCEPIDYATAVFKQIMDINYRKFKPTTDRYPDNDALHDVYEEIWGVVTSLRAPWEGVDFGLEWTETWDEWAARQDDYRPDPLYPAFSATSTKTRRRKRRHGRGRR